MSDPRSITLSLRGKWHGRYGVAPCPICQPTRRKGQNALTIAEKGGRLFLHCKKGHCDFRDLLAAVGLDSHRVGPPDPLAEARWRAEEAAKAERKAQWARRVWNQTRRIGGTPAEAYLRGRGITCPLPSSLRSAPSLYYSEEMRLPAMVARVDGVEGFAVHRTYLQPDGAGKAEVDAPKKMLGHVSGGAVRLVEPPRGVTWPLVVAEGIETALSLASGLLSGHAAVWAALSAGGLAGLRLPSEPGELVVATDGEHVGREAGDTLARRAASLGWSVSLLPAPEGRDWNDVLQERVAA